jgi:membrane associated rhomboid family serine protease
VNTFIIITNFIVYGIAVVKPDMLAPFAHSLEDIVNYLGVKPYFIVRGEMLWTIFTGMFVHAGLLHILGNMLYLYIFGDNVEAAMGHFRYLLFYLLSGIGAVVFHVVSISLMSPSSLLNYAYSGMNPWLVPAVGASGAISGVLGAYILLYPGALIRTVGFWFWIPLFLRLPASIYILFWFFYQLIMGVFALTGVPTGVAFWAHIGGFLTGMALVPLFVKRERVHLLRRLAWLRRWITYY